MCKEFHQTTRKLSDRFLATLQRHNYVTPTSYLELISTYKTLLSKKRRWGLLTEGFFLFFFCLFCGEKRH